MDAVGVADNLVDVVGEGVFHLVQGVHLVRTAALVGHTVIIPPRELRDEDLLVVAVHQKIVNGVLEDILTAVCQQHLLFGNTVDLADADGNDALFTLVVDAGIEAQVLRIKVPNGINYFLAWFKVELVSIKIIHIVNIMFLLCGCKISHFS